MSSSSNTPRLTSRVFTKFEKGANKQLNRLEMCDSATQDFLGENMENSKEISLFDVDTSDSGFPDDMPEDFDKLVSSPLSLEDGEATILCFSPKGDSDSNPCTPGNGWALGKKKRLFFSPEINSPGSQAASSLKRLRLFDFESKDTHDAACEIEFELLETVEEVALVPSLETQKNIVKSAVEKSVCEGDLIGDFSRSYVLPLVSGSHPDLKCISVETMKDVLEGKYSSDIDSYTIIDSRYPYEFEGGHIRGALNFYTKEDYLQLLDQPAKSNNERHILIFHCEFSKERGPNMVRQLRREDRTKNAMSYPSLNYPELYVLEGGYKQFFHAFPEHCDPKEYTQMLHPQHSEEMRFFRRKCKSADDIKPGKKSAKSRVVRKFLSDEYN